MAQFKNPSNGHVISSGTPFLWTLLFGAFYFAFKGIWKHFFLSVVAALLTLGLAWFVYPFFAAGIVRSHFLEKGWVEVA